MTRYLTPEEYAERSGLTHRLAYTLLVGPIPDGMTIDHICSVRLCVNPAHLEPVTLGENIARATARRRARKAA